MNTYVLTQTLGEKLSIGVEVSLVGIAIVFLVLAILWGILELFRVFFYEIPKKKKEKMQASHAETKEQMIEASPTEANCEIPDDTRMDEELIAAISAAVSMEIGKPVGSFRVVSFHRTSKK